MLKTTVTNQTLSQLKFLLETNDLSVLVGPPQKLLRNMPCAVSGQMLYDEGHLIEGIGYCSTEVAALMLIRGLVEHIESKATINSIASEFAAKAAKKAQPETNPLEAEVKADPAKYMVLRNYVEFADFLHESSEYFEHEPMMARRVQGILGSYHDQTVVVFPITEENHEELHAARGGLKEFGIDSSLPDLAPNEVQYEDGSVVKVDGSEPAGTIEINHSTKAHTPLVFQARPDEKRKPETVTIKKGNKVNVMDLPSGTVLRFEQEPQPEFDRTPVGPDFDMSQVPQLDRDLVRTQFDVDNGITTRGVTMTPWTGAVIRKQADFDLSQLSAEDRPYFEGYTGGETIIRNASDVAAYEGRFSDAAIAEAVEAEFAEEDVRELGHVITDKDVAKSQPVRREGGRASIQLPDKCLGAPATKR